MESIVLEIPSRIVSQMKLPPGRAQYLVMQELVLRLYQVLFPQWGPLYKFQSLFQWRIRT